MRSRDEALSRLSMRNPWHLLATGFGSGLSPVVPGTMGSLAAIPFWYLMTFLPWQLYSLVVMMSICIGVYLCHRTAKDMGTHDHGSIVWDEFVGMWITLMALPTLDWQWVAAGFVIFRIFDMWKPWPYPRLCAAGTRHETRWREAGGLDLCYRHSGRQRRRSGGTAESSNGG
ncbi:phosphatidylglycerophosphatase A [Klebsiella pneumoniae]|nr:phosphatidylglycerophosphatase A [Klebsiella pneumoniae]